MIYLSTRKFRQFMLLLYPDDITCSSTLDYLISNFSICAYCLHDKDIDENGDLKKPHYHFIVQLSSPRSLSFSLSDDFRVPLNLIEPIHDWRHAVRYLVHYDDCNKYKYDVSCIVSSFDVSSFFYNDETEKAAVVFDIACNSVSFRSFVGQCIDKKMWSVCRSGASLWAAIIKENQNFIN